MPVIVPPARASFVAIELVTVVEKLASSPRAAASSFKVSRAAGAESTRFASAVVTYAVVAIFVLLSEAAAVAPVVVLAIVPARAPCKFVALTVVRPDTVEGSPI